MEDPPAPADVEPQQPPIEPLSDPAGVAAEIEGPAAKEAGPAEQAAAAQHEAEAKEAGPTERTAAEVPKPPRQPRAVGEGRRTQGDSRVTGMGRHTEGNSRAAGEGRRTQGDSRADGETRRTEGDSRAATSRRTTHRTTADVPVVASRAAASRRTTHRTTADILVVESSAGKAEQGVGASSLGEEATTAAEPGGTGPVVAAAAGKGKAPPVDGVGKEGEQSQVEEATGGIKALRLGHGDSAAAAPAAVPPLQSVAEVAARVQGKAAELISARSSARGPKATPRPGARKAKRLSFSAPPVIPRPKTAVRHNYSHSPQRVRQILHDNEALVKRLSEITYTGSRLDLDMEKHDKLMANVAASSAKRRQTDASRIVQENFELFKRLQAVKASRVVSRKEHHKSFLKSRQYVENMATIRAEARGGSMAVLPTVMEPEQAEGGSG